MTEKSLQPGDFVCISDQHADMVAPPHYLSPSAKRVVLSAEQIGRHNELLDEYMQQHYPNEWVHDIYMSEVSQYVLAATGRIFLRIVDGLDGSYVAPVDEEGVVYMLTDPFVADAIWEETMDIIYAQRLH